MIKNLIVITPTLGRSRFLEETVRSVADVAREISLRHLLVCPAGEVAALAERFPEATVVGETSAGGGLYGAVANALAAAGEWRWFTYINDDDLLSPGFAEMAARHDASNTSSIAYGKVDLIDEEGRKIAPFPICRNPRWFYALWSMGITPFTQQGSLVSREVWDRVGGFEGEFRLNADFAFWAKAMKKEVPFCFYPSRVAAFRMRKGQLSADLGAVAEEKRKILEKYFHRKPGPGERCAARIYFRLTNIGAYATRLRRKGFRRSEAMLGEGGV